MKKNSLKKLYLITNNTLRQVLVSFFGLVIPFMVIHFSNKEIWGDFVSIYLFCLLALQIINWGNKEYLLRKFSQNPADMVAVFSENTTTRFPLVLLLAGIGLFLFPIHFGIWILFWLFGRYLNHSIEALLLYEKKFKEAMLIEIGSFLIFSIVFLCLKTQLNTYLLLISFSAYQLLKGLLYFVLFKNYFFLRKAKLHLAYFKKSFSFFLLSIMGFLASKIDVYIIEQFDNKTATSDYQIINGLLVFIMSISTFIYTPFTKNIYRNSYFTIEKTKKVLAVIGLIIVPISLLFVYGILHYFLNLELTIWFYFVAFLYVFPSYVYGIEIISLFKQHKEKRVVLFLFIGTICNWMLSFMLLKVHFGIIENLIGGAIAQLVIMFLFKSKKII